MLFPSNSFRGWRYSAGICAVLTILSLVSAVRAGDSEESFPNLFNTPFSEKKEVSTKTSPKSEIDPLIPSQVKNESSKVEEKPKQEETLPEKPAPRSEIDGADLNPTRENEEDLAEKVREPVQTLLLAAKKEETTSDSVENVQRREEEKQSGPKATVSTLDEAKASKPLLFSKPAIASADTPARPESPAPAPLESARPNPPVAKSTPDPVVPKPLSIAAAGKEPSGNLPVPTDLDEATYELVSERKVGRSDLVETLLEVTGTVKQLDPELKQVNDKMEVVAGFRYEERLDRFSSKATGALRSIRQYNLAKAKMKIGDSLKVPELDPELRQIICVCEEGKAVLFPPSGQLTGDQLLLIEDLPGNTLVLDRLLPSKPVRVGDAWKIPESVLQSFLSVDAVTDAEIEAVLTAVADQMAMVEIVGNVSGVYLGAATEMEVRAKYQFDLHAGRINWLGMMIEEDRSIGHVGPGLELVARLQVKISPLEQPESLTDDRVAGMNKEPGEETMILKYEAGKGPWRFRHDRNWYIFQDEEQTTVLRRLNRGDLVAQCNIADMGRVDPATMTTLEKFQKELGEGLGESFESIASAEESSHPAGYKEYCVHIDGKVDDLPLRWIYYLLTDKKGNQAVVVFVIERGQLETFDSAGRELIDSFRLGRGSSETARHAGDLK